MNHLIRKSPLVALGIFFALILLAFLLYQALKPSETASYTLSSEGDVLMIDCGEILSAYEPLEFLVPLERLGLSADSIREVKSTCKCTVPEIQSQDTHILITYKPDPDTINIYQVVTILPADANIPPKFIRVTGKLVPAWFAQPTSIVLDSISPDEKHTFFATVEINYELRKISINYIRLNPPTDTCFLELQITDKNKFIIKGIVNGLPQSHAYKGNIEIGFDTGPFKKFTLPLRINHTGTISANPGIVTFDGKLPHEAIVEFKHFKNIPLEIEKIDHPEYLRITRLKYDENRCSLKIGLREDLIPQKQVTSSKIKVTFTGINSPAWVHVMIISNS